MAYATQRGSLYITGLGHEYPRYTYGQEEFENVITKMYPQYRTSPGLQKLIQLNRKTQIQSRQSVLDITSWTADDAVPPPIDELSRMYRRLGVDLAAAASTKAMQDANVVPADITHVVAVTCTDQGNPGFELLVCKQLKLQPTVQRVLLHGVGCAGGLSALRTAADIAAAETYKGRVARVLVVACELCSLFLKAELHAANQDETLHVAPALFSDAAAAIVVCNSLAMEKHQEPLFQLLEWGSLTVPGSLDHMSYCIQPDGMIATITKDVPIKAVGAIQPILDHLRAAANRSPKENEWTQLKPSEFDWALHPGGAAILQGAQQALQLSNSHLHASRNIYHSYGNSSSPTVLIVLEELQKMAHGRDHVVAASFGPGMMIEMCVMKRCRDDMSAQPLQKKKKLGKTRQLWPHLQCRLARMIRRISVPEPVRKVE